MNILVHVSLGVCVCIKLLGIGYIYPPFVGTAKLLMYLIHISASKQYMIISIAPHSYQRLMFSELDFCQYDRDVSDNCIVVLICIVQITGDIEHLFICMSFFYGREAVLFFSQIF